MTSDEALFEQIAIWSQVAGAVIFFAALVYLFVRFLAPMIEKQQQAKNAELAEAEGRRDRAQADIAAARAEVEQADRDAVAIKERTIADVKREREKMLAETKDEGERAVRNAEGELARARAAANATLRADMIERALQLARKEADARIDASANAGLVANLVDALERKGGR
jgi:F0F1-type ATP synthase membrane subunit b/b'